ncbi:MAG: Cys-Gln thioester bond-forming surface protein [Oscillospiraceae bacterium]|jgi:hypothetical protein|nr:Cys-Gln thioester bond-forming surface protein [Oscillospiraceae bacterium]
MEKLKRAILNKSQRVLAVLLALVLVVGLLPAFELEANAATYLNLLDYFTRDELTHTLKAGDKVKMNYIREGGILYMPAYLSYTSGSAAKTVPGRYSITFGDEFTLDTMPAFCIEHGQKMVNSGSQLTLVEYSDANKALVMGAFANGHKNTPYWIFLDQKVVNSCETEYIDAIRPLGGWDQGDGDPFDGWLTEDEYWYATQLAVWAALGQIGVEGAKGAALQVVTKNDALQFGV